MYIYNAFMYVDMDVRMCVCAYECMYICTYRYVCMCMFPYMYTCTAKECSIISVPVYWEISLLVCVARRRGGRGRGRGIESRVSGINESCSEDLLHESFLLN